MKQKVGGAEPIPLSERRTPCALACRALLACYRARLSGTPTAAAMARYLWLYGGLNDFEKSRLERFQERIERLLRRV